MRLSINDLSPDGAQPFHSPNGKIHAVVNGEFYDYDRIRKELEDTTDYVFRSRSDSEIVIALYMHHGLNFVHYLRGEFAVVLFDEEETRVNRGAGTLLRTKGRESDEGGVAVGYSVVDSPVLV